MQTSAGRGRLATAQHAHMSTCMFHKLRDLSEHVKGSPKHSDAANGAGRACVAGVIRLSDLVNGSLSVATQQTAPSLGHREGSIIGVEGLQWQYSMGQQYTSNRHAQKHRRADRQPGHTPVTN